MSSFARLITFLVVLGGGLVTGGVLIWYLSYGLEHGPPTTVEVAAVADTVWIGWGDEGIAAIEAGGYKDAMAALGYIHGWEHAWSLVLWRQAALGRLGEWFGPPALPLDSLTRRLDLARLAQESTTLLGAEDRAILDAYVGGVNTALQHPAIRLRQEFVLLGQEPEPWHTWHTLALERLFAWLAAPPPAPDGPRAAGATATAFYEADRALRQWLHLRGFENSIAWIAQDETGAHFFQRHVYGATALPLFQEITLKLEDGTAFQGASLPGTTFFPAGQSEQGGWALLMTASAQLERIPWHPDSASVSHQRIYSNDGAEHLLSLQRMPGRLPLLPSEGLPPDTVWSLRWPGLTPGSDCPAWRSLIAGTPIPFSLLDGAGLWMSRDGNWQILGSPQVEITLPSGIFVGSSSWSTHAAEFLENQGTGPVQLESWIDDAFSIWAAKNAPPLVGALDALQTPSSALRDAITYLKNWDYTYDRASIAASIFDRWMRAYLDATGSLPGTQEPDTTETVNPAANPMLQPSLVQAVEALIEGYGPDQSQWRWERVHPDRRFFPIWSIEALQETPNNPGAKTRFAAVEWPGYGHPSALAWGPSPTQLTLAAPAAWEAWLHTNTWSTLAIRRRRIDPRAPLGRYLISDRPPEPITLPLPQAFAATTVLTPSS